MIEKFAEKVGKFLQEMEKEGLIAAIVVSDVNAEAVGFSPTIVKTMETPGFDDEIHEVMKKLGPSLTSLLIGINCRSETGFDPALYLERFKEYYKHELTVLEVADSFIH